MEFYANEGKKSGVEVNGKKYMRHSIKTHFVKQGEDYVEVFKKYVSPLYQEGDIVSTSEKIIALCQNRVVKREELKIGFWAKLLSKFASHPDTGYGVGETIKMQYAIHEVGLPKVLWASIGNQSAGKPFHGNKAHVIFVGKLCKCSNKAVWQKRCFLRNSRY